MSEELFVLGHPVGHSKSPAMYNAVYQALGLDWHYDYMDCATTQDAQAFLDAGKFLSINITMPYKPLAFQFAKGATVAAKLARGANVLVRTPDGYVCDNTDGIGCVDYLQRRGANFDGAFIAICGTGTAARAIMHACLAAGVDNLTLIGRSVDKAQHMIDQYRADLAAVADDDAVLGESARCTPHQILKDACFTAAEYGSPDAQGGLDYADVVIDATSLGMQKGDPAPFDPSVLQKGQIVFDVVYAHGTTKLIGGARKAGCEAYDGEGMLVSQAVATVRDIMRTPGTGLDEDVLAQAGLSEDDLFALMARAAGFSRLADIA